MENLPKYRESCMYCYTDIYEKPILFTACGSAVCESHLKSSFFPLYKIYKTKNDEAVIESEVLSEEEKNQLRKYIENAQNISLTNKKKCEHKLLMNCEPVITERINLNCMKCDLKENLYLCLSCGFIGCGRKQFGSIGNGHAAEHFENTQHLKSTKVEDLRINGDNSTFCYLCDDFIEYFSISQDLQKLNLSQDNIQELLSQCEKESQKTNRDEEKSAAIDNIENKIPKKSTKSAKDLVNSQDNKQFCNYENESKPLKNSLSDDNNASIIQNNPSNLEHIKVDRKQNKSNCPNNISNFERKLENESDLNIKSETVGIENAYNTCFMSTTFHLFSLILRNIDMALHFDICEKISVDCLTCQFIRIIEALKDRKYKKIDIIDFLNIYTKIDEDYVINTQQDPSEFIYLMLAYLQNEFNNGQICDIFSLFTINIKKVIKIFKNDQGTNSGKSSTEYSEKIKNNIRFIDNSHAYNPQNNGLSNVQSNWDQLKADETHEIIELFNIILLENSQCLQKSIDILFDIREENLSPNTVTYSKLYVQNFPEFIIANINWCTRNESKIEKIKNPEFHVNSRILFNNVTYEKCAAILHRGVNPSAGHFVIDIHGSIMNDTSLDYKDTSGDAYIVLFKRVDS